MREKKHQQHQHTSLPYSGCKQTNRSGFLRPKWQPPLPAHPWAMTRTQICGHLLPNLIARWCSCGPISQSRLCQFLNFPAASTYLPKCGFWLWQEQPCESHVRTTNDFRASSGDKFRPTSGPAIKLCVRNHNNDDNKQSGNLLRNFKTDSKNKTLSQKIFFPCE